MLSPAIVLSIYFAVGFLTSSIITRYGYTENDDTRDVIFGFIMVMMFWPLAAAVAALYLPARAFYKYVQYLQKLGSSK